VKRLDAYTTYLLMTASSAFFFSLAFTTSAIYRFQMAGLDTLQLVLLGTVLEGSVFLFEIPTGIVADIYSRRLSVIIGFALIGLGMLLEGSLQLFVTILLAQVVWGIGYTFISGAQDAWLADEIGEERLTSTYLRGSQFAQVAALAGIIINVVLASIQLNLPFFFAGAGHIALAGFLALYMPERGFKPTLRSERHTWQKMGVTFRDGMNAIRERPLLVTILGIALVYGLYSEALDRLWEAHILDNFSLPPIDNINSVVWFGLINASIMIIAIGTTGFLRRRASKLDHGRMVKVLALFSGVISAGLMLFGLASGFSMALLSYSTVAIVRKTMQPLYSAWINRGIPTQVRATVLSTYGQMDAIGQLLGGPVVGIAANRFGLRAAIVLAGVLLAPVLALYRRAYNQGD
jgi:DHA3 family tetracycline resistance protein-like MFS transporter